jgi:hypothetical protein
MCAFYPKLLWEVEMRKIKVPGQPGEEEGRGLDMMACACQPRKGGIK